MRKLKSGNKSVVRGALTKDVLEGGVELLLTEMSDKELLNLVKLDIYTAQET